MLLRLLFLVIIFLSQVLYLGVFASDSGYIVVRERDNMCGRFTPGNTIAPNWLPLEWKVIGLHPDLAGHFRQITSCSDSTLARCCRDAGYRYAGVPIGDMHISEQRKSAEFLSSRSIIERKNLNPIEYRLSDTITRKEVMKVIGQVANLPYTSCRNSFSDVENDWGCSYIEAALTRGFIERNELFRPDDTITQTETLKLILQARDIKKRYNTQFWQQDYISTAVYLGYLDEKYSDYNIVSTRGWVFQVLARTYGDDFYNW
ncbi:S-layer homology domain-containing protein [Candidatus Gracilibacteria bacterium]|nr:S-layer homology domain-containing protein [Candidatus Gracilibacteria bacterium]